MSDISMCTNKDCDKSSSCYRFLAIPRQGYQSYIDFKTICHAPEYKFYIEMENNA